MRSLAGLAARNMMSRKTVMLARSSDARCGRQPLADQEAGSAGLPDGGYVSDCGAHRRVRPPPCGIVTAIIPQRSEPTLPRHGRLFHAQRPGTKCPYWRTVQPGSWRTGELPNHQRRYAGSHTTHPAKRRPPSRRGPNGRLNGGQLCLGMLGDESLLFAGVLPGPALFKYLLNLRFAFSEPRVQKLS
jgi:hypothetical protein